MLQYSFKPFHVVTTESEHKFTNTYIHYLVYVEEHNEGTHVLYKLNVHKTHIVPGRSQHTCSYYWIITTSDWLLHLDWSSVFANLQNNYNVTNT